jgi:hypothetical protein
MRGVRVACIELIDDLSSRASVPTDIVRDELVESACPSTGVVGVAIEVGACQVVEVL